MFRRVLIAAVVVLMLAGCNGPDLRPAMEKIKESMLLYEPDLEAYWGSDLFMEGKPDDLREVARDNRLENFKATMETIDTALNPKKENHEDNREASKEVNGE